MTETVETAAAILPIIREVEINRETSAVVVVTIVTVLVVTIVTVEVQEKREHQLCKSESDFRKKKVVTMV